MKISKFSIVIDELKFLLLLWMGENHIYCNSPSAGASPISPHIKSKCQSTLTDCLITQTIFLTCTLQKLSKKTQNLGDNLFTFHWKWQKKTKTEKTTAKQFRRIHITFVIYYLNFHYKYPLGSGTQNRIIEMTFSPQKMATNPLLLLFFQ